jgi:[ribosomal protein S18]-alanine N-acetyltransferase
MIVRPLTGADTAELLSWRYPGRYATYELKGDEDLSSYAVVEDDGVVIGCCCFGAEARVDGVHDEPGVADVGWGLRPDLMGRGHGRAFVEAILAAAAERYRPTRFRATILDWNERSLRAAESVGFVRTGAVEHEEGLFLVLERAA